MTKFLRVIIVAAITAIVGGTAHAERLSLKEGHPTSYTVKKGDTLWDISEHFLNSPWLWPRLWQANPQVENPHLIYPGDVLTLVWIDGEPRLVRKPTVKVGPQGRITDKGDAIPTIPLSVIMPFLTRDHILDEGTLKGAPYLLGEAKRALAMAEGDTVYGKGNFDPNLQYGVYRRGQMLSKPILDEKGEPTKKREPLGYEARFVGLADVVTVRQDGPTTLKLHDSVFEAKQGDAILPLPETDSFPAFFVPKATPSNLRANIIKSAVDHRAIGKYDVVFVDVGAVDGMEPGSMLRVMMPGATVVDKDGNVTYTDVANHYERTFVDDSDKAVDFPDESIGHLMIFRVYERVSLAVVVRSSELILDKFPLTGMEF